MEKGKKIVRVGNRLAIVTTRDKVVYAPKGGLKLSERVRRRFLVDFIRRIAHLIH